MSNLIEYTLTAYHILENNKHPEHKFYATTEAEAEKISDDIIAEFYDDENADFELWADYMLPQTTTESK